MLPTQAKAVTFVTAFLLRREPDCCGRTRQSVESVELAQLVDDAQAGMPVFRRRSAPQLREMGVHARKRLVGDLPAQPRLGAFARGVCRRQIATQCEGDAFALRQKHVFNAALFEASGTGGIPMLAPDARRQHAFHMHALRRKRDRLAHEPARLSRLYVSR